jgi:hypothetical protein
MDDGDGFFPKEPRTKKKIVETEWNLKHLCKLIHPKLKFIQWILKYKFALPESELANKVSFHLFFCVFWGQMEARTCVKLHGIDNFRATPNQFDYNRRDTADFDLNEFYANQFSANGAIKI